jgi:hypothetical protein
LIQRKLVQRVRDECRVCLPGAGFDVRCPALIYGLAMLDFLLSPPVVPFSLALGLLAGLLLLEIAALAIGATLLAKDAEKFDFDAEPPALDAPDAPDLPELPAPADLAQMDMGAIDAADLDLGPPPAPAPAGLGAVLGLGRVPFLIWLAALLAGFGLSGYLLQSLAARLLGWPLPVWLAVLPATAAGLWFARAYGRALARLIPGTESSVRSEAMLNRKRGVVSQGTARAGQPAEVRVADSFGNLHYIRAEPLDVREAIPQGAEVLVLRILQGPARGQFRLIPLSARSPSEP